MDDWVSYAPALHITSVELDDNYIYFGSRRGGILRLDKYTEQWADPYTISSGLRSNTILKVVYDRDQGLLYAKTPKGIDVYRPAENFWRPAPDSKMPSPQRPSRQDLSSISQNDNDRFRFPPLYRPSNSELPDFFTRVDLMYHLGGTFFDRQNRQYHFTDRITDSWRRLWIGSDGFGPLVADLDHIFLKSYHQSIPDISPRDLYIDEDNIWIGGIRHSELPGGIVHWDQNEDIWEYFEAFSIPDLYKDDINAIDGNNKFIFFATSHGLTLLEKRKLKWKTLDARVGLEGDFVYDVLALKDNVYIATEYGLNWLTLPSFDIQESHETTLDNVRINQLAKDDSSIWAATRDGLYQIIYNTGEIYFHASRAVLSDYNLSAVEVIGDEIWIANGSGIAYWNRTKDEWHSFPGLILNARINDIDKTKNTIWFATDIGLLKYSRKQDYWRLFTEADGLIDSNTSRLEADGNYIWICTKEGVSSFRWRRKGRID
jgi:ligand-binding sensor domain-containing protein